MENVLIYLGILWIIEIFEAENLGILSDLS